MHQQGQLDKSGDKLCTRRVNLINPLTSYTAAGSGEKLHSSRVICPGRRLRERTEIDQINEKRRDEMTGSPRCSLIPQRETNGRIH